MLAHCKQEGHRRVALFANLVFSEKSGWIVVEQPNVVEQLVGFFHVEQSIMELLEMRSKAPTPSTERIVVRTSKSVNVCNT